MTNRFYVFLLIITLIIVFWTFKKKSESVSLKDKRILITGASKGLGRCLSKLLDKEGAKLILWDIDVERLTSLLEKLKNRENHLIQQVDVSDSKLINESLNKINANEIDIVIGNAGIMLGKRLEDIKEDEMDKLLGVNLKQHFFLYKEFAQWWKFKQSQSTLVMISSVAGLVALTNLSDYCASKFALVGLSEGIRLELRKKSTIHTLLVMPFLIDTKMFSGIKLSFPANLMLKILKKENVAKDIIEAIKQKKQWLVLPWFLRFLPLILTLPIGFRNFIYDLIKENSYML